MTTVATLPTWKCSEQGENEENREYHEDVERKRKRKRKRKRMRASGQI